MEYDQRVSPLTSQEMASARRTWSVPYTPSPPSTPIATPRLFLPIQPHPTISHLPHLPTPSRQPRIHAAYALTTHLIPAAFPRSVPDIPLPVIPPHSTSPTAPDRQAQVASLARQLEERQASFVQGKLCNSHSQRPLWNCVNRYARTDNRGHGISLFLAHANGFFKEIWEVMLRDLFDSPAAPLVDEVWSWEAVHHGDSALVNAGNLSGIVDWQDNARDIANFLLNYLPDDTTPASLPTHLERIPKSTSDARKDHGYSKRTLVVVGHSFGGTTSILAALNFPKLFSSLILVDPVIGFNSRSAKETDGNTSNLTLGALIRRDIWPSREEALRLFKQSPFFASWHPQVLELYVNYGLTADSASNGVKLKMSPLQEALTFVDTRVAKEVWELLETLDANITLRWIVPIPGVLDQEQVRMGVWRRPSNTSNVVFPFAGHLVVQEAPVELGG
ncbi:Alpha/beta hydrolase family-domain-containing protein [Scleroderma citrinum]